MDRKITFAAIRDKPPDGMPDVRVCDFPMGGGKTQSLIRELNMRYEDSEDFRVIVLLTQKTEDRRIRKYCPALNFVIPDRSKNDRRSVTDQTVAYIKEGRNIASTHAAFIYYKEDIRSLVKEYGYSLYIDESISAIDVKHHDVGDIQFLINKGSILQNERGEFVITGDKDVDGYTGQALKDIFRTFQSRGIAMMDTELPKNGVHSTVLWIVPPSLFTAFHDVTIITFNFKGQQLSYYLDAEHIPYRYIGVGKDGDTNEDFYFTDNPDEYHYPDYIHNLKNLVHVFENERMRGMNYFGRDRYALSMSWYKKPKNVELVSRMIDSFYRNSASLLTDDYGADKRLWSVYKDNMRAMAKRGTRLSPKSFLSYSIRAVNDYSDKTLLAYAVNIFPNVTESIYWSDRGYIIDEDLFALNHMIQWIWRSAIRNNEEIWVLVPANRMRDLLKNWLENPLQYCQIP